MVANENLLPFAVTCFHPLVRSSSTCFFRNLHLTVATLGWALFIQALPNFAQGLGHFYPSPSVNVTRGFGQR